MTKKKKCKSRARSLANLKPGANLKHGAFQFLRTGKIPPGDKDIADEAKRLRKQLIETYCQPGNFILAEVQSRVIDRVVTDHTFSELLWRHLWSEAARASGGDKLQQCLCSSNWSVLLASDKKIGKAFRELERNLTDFTDRPRTSYRKWRRFRQPGRNPQNFGEGA